MRNGFFLSTRSCHVKPTTSLCLANFKRKDNLMKLNIPKIMWIRSFSSFKFYPVVIHTYQPKCIRNLRDGQYFWKRFSSNESTDSQSKWTIPSGFETRIHIYNPIVKCKVPLVLERKSYATWYMCGPTVYDSAHLGHACCYVKFDIIRRILEQFFGITVVTAMSVTDVDDKIINRAKVRNEDIAAISSRYEIEFWEDLKTLNVIPPDAPLKVTKHIDEIISFVSKIIGSGMAYSTTDGSVYFDTASYKNYGKFVSVSKEMEDSSGEFCHSNKPESLKHKKSPMDFALWKGNADTSEIGWPSPWGSGRPGWHIECSAMASKFFGSKIDLHSGGVDLIFPHHENEDAQSCAHHGINQWVNYWLHTGHLHLKGQEKMSKSLKNTLSIRDFLSSFTANQFRMFCLLSHYRFGVAYSNETMGNAVAIMKKIESFLCDVNAYVLGLKDPVHLDESVLEDHLSRFEVSFQNHLADDFNTPAAMSDLIDLMTYCNKILNPISKLSKPNMGLRGNSTVPMASVASVVKKTLEKLGISFKTDEVLQSVPCIDSSPGKAINMKQIINSAVEFREEVRNLTLEELKKKTGDDSRKDYLKKILNTCDICRSNMGSAGVTIKDHGTKSSWVISEAEKKS